jgi:DNA-binding NtrC family response regulator
MDLGKHCLFIVEDDPDLHLLFARVAEREGFRVESAQSGEQALLAVKKLRQPVDALLTDIRLPGHTDGWALGREFGRLHPEASVIYVSGVEADQEQRGPHTLFLEKPVQVSNLTAALRWIQHPRRGGVATRSWGKQLDRSRPGQWPVADLRERSGW